MTRPQSFQLPLPEEYDIAIEKLDLIWDKLVPRSTRPLHLPLKEDIARILERSMQFAERRAAPAAAARASFAANGGPIAAVEAGAEGPADIDESPLATAMRYVRRLTDEEFHQVKILMMLRELSDEKRAELFFELEDTHHVDCGAEIVPGEPHECALGPEEADGASVEAAVAPPALQSAADASATATEGSR